MVYNGSILKFNSILISKFTCLVLLAVMTETSKKSVFSCPRRYTNYSIADWGMLNDWLNTLWLLGWMTCCKWLCTEVEEVEKGRWLQFVIGRPRRLTGQLGARTQSPAICPGLELHIKDWWESFYEEEHLAKFLQQSMEILFSLPFLTFQPNGG